MDVFPEFRLRWTIMYSLYLITDSVVCVDDIIPLLHDEQKIRGNQMTVAKRTGVTIIQFSSQNMDTSETVRKKRTNLTFWVPVKKNKIKVAPMSQPAFGEAISFQEALKVPMMIGQMFSLAPIARIASHNAADLKFVRCSWKYLYSLLSLLGQLFITIMCFIRLVTETTLKATTPLIFYGSTLITMLIFMKVAQTWPPLVRHIARTEEIDPNYDSKLVKRCNITSAVVLMLALFEHILSLLSAFAAALVCYPNKQLYEGFVRHFYPWVFNYIPYSTVLGLLTQFLHFQSTFVWNYSDLFVICMSYYLTSRLDQVNKKLLAAQGKYLPETFWKTSRENYCRVTQLVRKLDDVISGIIFISFANNLFFICLQLFNTLENGIKGTGECSSRALGNTKKEAHILGGYESSVYFMFSLVFLITRSIAVSLIASQVHGASYVPAPVLYDVPSAVYCVEVQRFLDQVNGDKVALTGLQFFSVTRGLLLTVAGTIVTYELVMVQFNSPTSTALPNITTTVSPMITTTSPTPFS